MKTQDELWGNVFAKIKQYGLNKEVLDKLKELYTIKPIIDYRDENVFLENEHGMVDWRETQMD